jgi:predicted DNA-binding protein
MSTSKKRLNISLPDDVSYALAQLARRDSVPQATKVARLLETALELEEDQAWEAIAEQRDKKNVRYIPHDKAWR